MFRTIYKLRSNLRKKKYTQRRTAHIVQHSIYSVFVGVLLQHRGIIIHAIKKTFLHLEDLHTLVEADAHPVFVRRIPLQLVDLALGRKRQNRIFNGDILGGGNVPDECLLVIRHRANVIRCECKKKKGDG
jgi:hypothetical protein